MNIFDSYIDAGQQLNQREKEQYYTALVEFIAYDFEPKLKGAALAVFTAIRPSLELSKQRANSGRKGGKSQGKAEAKGDFATEQTASKTEASDEAKPQAMSKSRSKSKNSSPIGEAKKPRFVPPTEEEVDAYLAERGLSAYLSGTQFVGYYGSQGWKKANGQPVTNWKLAASGWADRKRKESEPSEQRGGDRYAQYD